MNKPQKVFIGLCDIASFISEWDYGFKELGIRTLKGSTLYQHPFQTSKLDFVIQKTRDKIKYFEPLSLSRPLKRRWNKLVEHYYFNKAVKECDIFLFIWNSFKEDFWDYKYLKQKGKKIITLFVGDEVRWYHAMKQEFESSDLRPIEYENYEYTLLELERRLIYLRTAERYSDIILSKPNMSQLALRPYFNVFIPIPFQKSPHSNQQRKAPRIIHAPSSASFKGSKFIGEVIERLKKEAINFEFKKIQNMPHEQAIKEYLDADIIIDQLLCPGGGKLAYECLAMSKIVLTLMASSKYDQKKPADCPLVDVTPETLYETLKSLILDHGKRIELAKKGRPYIEKYHDPAIVVKQVIDLLSKPESERVPDFYPTFFRDKFIPESAESIPVYNKWTEKVKDCDWYKKYIKPGERAGLKF